MNKLLKPFALLILITSLFVATSCLKSEENSRTEETEKTEISNYLLTLIGTGNHIDTTASGMYYFIFTEGAGEYPQPGDTCYIEYVGYFINGSIFDASANHHSDGIEKMVYKEKDLIPGFEEAIGLMKKGEGATFVIPSKLAYGSDWYDYIPPYTPLIFDIIQHDIKSKAVQ